MRRLLTIVMSAVLLCGCGGNPKAVELLARADSLMDVRPDSALTVLNEGIAVMDDSPESLRMRYRLLQAKAQNKAFQPFTSDSLMLAVADYYDRHGTANERMEAHYLLGCVYRDLGDAPRALEAYLDATAKADTAQKGFDFYTLGCAYSQMASLYYKQQLFSNEIKARKNAALSFKCLGDTFYVIHQESMIAGTYIALNKVDSAEFLLKDVIVKNRNLGYVQKALQTSTMLMHLYKDNPSLLPELKDLIDQYDLHSEAFDELHELYNADKIFYYYKGRYFELCSNLDSAEYYYRKVYYPGIPFSLKSSAYKGLMSVFGKRHQADSLSKYSSLYGQANDSSIIIKDQELTALLSASYDHNYYKRLSLENERNAYRNWLIAIVLSITSLLVIVAVVLVGKKLFAKRFTLLKRELEETTKAYEQKLYALQLIEETHKQAMNDALTALSTLREEKEASLAEAAKAHDAIELINSSYHKEKAKLVEEIELLKKRIEDLNIMKNSNHSSTRSLTESSIVKKLRTLSEAHRPMNNKDTHLLTETVADAFPLLVQDLMRESRLSQNDAIVCILTVLAFSPSEICVLTNLSNSRVTNIRAKINQTLFGDKSASTLKGNLSVRYGIYLK